MVLLKDQFNKFKIKNLQLDPFGICNAKCWFCPVSYIENPKQSKQIMSPELLRKILKNLIDERNKDDGLVDKQFASFYTSHYNEILLYPHFEELLSMCDEYKLCLTILSNGIPFTPDKIDLISKYKNVVSAICLNIPAFEPELWSKRSGINIKQYDKLISNINYGIKTLPSKIRNKTFSIVVNGIDTNSFEHINVSTNFPNNMDTNLYDGELSTQVKLGKELFPTLQILRNSNLTDRAGAISDVFVSKNLSKNEKIKAGIDNPKVVGCVNDINIGGRPIGWLHINASGNAFLCCNDYKMDITFGNFNTQELSDFWGKDEHINKILQQYEVVCSKCSEAIYE